MIRSKNYIKNPFFSICIPHYNRTRHLIKACEVLSVQTFTDFEICISDDKSTDGLEQELLTYLEQSDISYVYEKQEINLRYDGNIRRSILLANGVYCILFGNDDCLYSIDTLNELYKYIIQYNKPSVVITNYSDWKTGEITRRIKREQLINGNINTAAVNFRNVAFVSGVLIHRKSAEHLHTNKWDGSEMYQMFIVASLMSRGGNLLNLEKVVVKKDIQLSEEKVESFRDNKIPLSHGFVLKLPIQKIGRVIVDAIKPYVSIPEAYKINEKIFLQLYTYTFPYWIISYRKAHGWFYALRYIAGISPFYTTYGVLILLSTKCKIYLIYIMMSVAGLIVPISIYNILEKKLHALAKR